MKLMFQVKATNGDTFLGGEDFDNALLDFFVKEFKTSEGIDLSKNRFALQRLRGAAEKAKIELSSTAQTVVNLPFITVDASGAKHFNITLSRSIFETLVNLLIERTRDPCKNCFKDAGINVEEVNEVLLVGGMTRVPKVQSIVLEIFGKPPSRGVNPYEVVAMVLHFEAVSFVVMSSNCCLLLDVTPLSLDIEVLGSVFTRLITPNTTIPTKKSLRSLLNSGSNFGGAGRGHGGFSFLVYFIGFGVVALLGVWQVSSWIHNSVIPYDPYNYCHLRDTIFEPYLSFLRFLELASMKEMREKFVKIEREMAKSKRGVSKMEEQIQENTYTISGLVKSVEEMKKEKNKEKISGFWSYIH